MRLVSGDHSVLVTPQGGSVLSWQYKQHHILGPARVVDVGSALKWRGESHWCYPNFGSVPAESSVPGEKHGFLRRSLLDLGKHSNNQARLESGVWSETGDVHVVSSVVIEGQRLGVSLQAWNKSLTSSKAVLPGYHPYFAIPPGGASVFIGSEEIHMSRISDDAMVVPGSDTLGVFLEGVGRVSMLCSPSCHNIVIWSDDRSQYLCVEPVFGPVGKFGTSFCKLLEPGHVECWEVDLLFVPEL